MHVLERKKIIKRLYSTTFLPKFIQRDVKAVSNLRREKYISI